MKRRRHSLEQILRHFAEHDRMLNEGPSIEEVARHLEIVTSTEHRWKNQHDEMKASDAKRHKELEVENGRLKMFLAEADRAMLKELAEGNF